MSPRAGTGLGPGSKLGPHYISQEPGKARAQLPTKPAGFVESLKGSITMNIFMFEFMKPDGLGVYLGNPERDPVPILKTRARPEPEYSEPVPALFRILNNK